MKNGLFTAFALLALPSLTAQVASPTSVPVNKTKTSLLSKQVDQLAQHDSQANFRLFLNYSAKSDFIVNFGDHPIEVTAGEKSPPTSLLSTSLIHLPLSTCPLPVIQPPNASKFPDRSQAIATALSNHSPEKTSPWTKRSP